ncbi:MAG: hypothetical protein HZB16_05085 [Armatimonadetes bacterium]|nr:hypothetical protein [Armatimonadota bacterium]
MGIWGIGRPAPLLARVAFVVEAPTVDARLLAGFGNDRKVLPSALYDALLRVEELATTCATRATGERRAKRALAREVVKLQLHSRDFTPEHTRQLDAAQASYAVMATGAPGDARLLIAARELVWRVAEQTGGLVVDGPAATVWLPPPGGWLAGLELSVTEEINSQVTYRAASRAGVWMRSLGLCKYGQPEVQITVPTDRLMAVAGMLIESVAARLVRVGGTVAVGDTLSLPYWGEVTLTASRDRHYGGPCYGVMVAGDDSRGLTRTVERLVAANAELYHARSVALDPELQAEAIRQAQATLDDMIARYPDAEAAELQGVRLRLMAGFPLEAPCEYLEVRVLAWGDPVVALVDCQPMHAPGVIFGQVVGLPRACLIDWKVGLPDGTIEGNFVGALLERADEVAPATGPETAR